MPKPVDIRWIGFRRSRPGETQDWMLTGEIYPTGWLVRSLVYCATWNSWTAVEADAHCSAVLGCHEYCRYSRGEGLSDWLAIPKCQSSRYFHWVDTWSGLRAWAVWRPSLHGDWDRGCRHQDFLFDAEPKRISWGRFHKLPHRNSRTRRLAHPRLSLREIKS